MSDHPIYITRIGAVSVLGAGFKSIAANLPNPPRIGSVRVYEFHQFDRDIPCFDAHTFDPEQVLGKKGLRTKDWSTKLLLAAMEPAFKSRFENIAPESKPGICVGTAFGSVQSIGDFLSDSIVNGVNAVNPQAFANTVINSPTGNANIRYEVRSLSATVATGFNAGADALVYACDHIRRGYLHSIAAGGLDEISYYGLLGLLRSGVLSLTGRILPFSHQADGMVAGEGCAMFLLETAESARAAGDEPVAEIAGYAMAFDPDTTAGIWGGEAARHVMRAACSDAGIETGQIDFIAASANGLKAGDTMEAEAIADVFGKVPVTAYKARLGECYGASPALSAACAIADMKAGRISGLPGGTECISTINCVKGTAGETNCSYALVNAFSCDGNCTSIVLRNMPSKQ